MAEPAFLFEPETPDEVPRLTLVPEYRPAVRRRWWFPALLVVAAMIAGGVTAFAWQQGRVSGRSRALAAANQTVSILVVRAGTLQNMVDTLRSEVGVQLEAVARLNAQIRDLQVSGLAAEAQLHSTQDQLAAVQGQLTTTQNQLTVVQGELATTQQQLVRATGPALPDGRYVGAIRAAAPYATPPRLAIWARTTLEGTSITEPGWRLLKVAPGTTVQLLGWHGAASTLMSFEAFARIYNGGSPDGASLRSVRYWISVQSDAVTAAGQNSAP